MKRLRIRYAILGAVLALLWLGNQGEPAWVHAVRLLLVLVTIPPLLTLTRRYRERQVKTSSQKHPNAALYWLVGTRVAVVSIALVLGQLVGHLVAPHHNDTIRQLVVRIVVLALTLPFQVKYERRRQSAGLPPGVQARSPMIIAAKFVLVLLALGAEWLIGRWTAQADVIVAAGMFVVVAALGPRLHPYLLTSRRKPVSGSPPPADGTTGHEPPQRLGVTD